MSVNKFGFVAEQLRGARTGRGLTQTELADLVGLRRETIYRIERGRGTHADTLARIAAALSLSNEYFIEAMDYSSNLFGHPRRTPLRARRRERGLTLEQCAAAAGVSATTLSRFERGNEHYPSICEVGRFGRAWAIHNDGLAHALGFADARKLTEFWLARR